MAAEVHRIKWCNMSHALAVRLAWSCLWRCAKIRCSFLVAKKRCTYRSNMGKSEVSRHCVGVYPYSSSKWRLHIYENRNILDPYFIWDLLNSMLDSHLETGIDTPKSYSFKNLLVFFTCIPVPFLCPHFRLVWANPGSSKFHEWSDSKSRPLRRSCLYSRQAQLRVKPHNL